MPAQTKRVRKPSYPASVLRFAKALDLNPEEVAQRIPTDTLRRLTAPMHVTNKPDGTTSYEHDRQIRVGRMASLQTDRPYKSQPLGTGGYGGNAERAPGAKSTSGGETPRDSSGSRVKKS